MLSLWLRARQAWYEQAFPQAIELYAKGLASPQAARFLPLLAAFAQDQAFDVPADQQQAAIELLLGLQGRSP